MKHIFTRLSFLKKIKGTFSKKHGILTNEDRSWEEIYRKRWQHDKIARSTHGVNCTGSCSWKIYVKNGIITWETQQTDYPRTRPGMPNHEPRGCQRGASYSWYIYSSARLKYPLIRSSLALSWYNAKTTYINPIDAWTSIQSDAIKRSEYILDRGKGGFIRGTWTDLNELITAANIYTIKKYGPDRVCGFSPIPAMSMISYAAGSRYLSLIGGVCLSFYDWYCDLPPSSPQVWGEQTDVPESADWYNSYFIILWGGNVPQTRTPDAHFFTEVQYKGAKTVVVSPDFSEAAKLTDLWLPIKQGTDSALLMALGHVILKEYYLSSNTKSNYFITYAKTYTDMPCLIILDETSDGYIPGRFLRASDIHSFSKEKNAEWKPLIYDNNSKTLCILKGSIGYRWDESKLWNLKNETLDPLLSFIDDYDNIITVCFPYYASATYTHNYFKNTHHDSILKKSVPVKILNINNKKILITTVFDLMVANYGIDRLNYESSSYNDNTPYTPYWQEAITGINKNTAITLARQFAENANKTLGKSLIITGAGLNHWYHMDMNYRGMINILMMCGCIGVSGGGWAHYVGQEKLRPQAGWLPLAFALDWKRPPRLMNATSFFYTHTSQWRHEKLNITEILSPLSINKDKFKHFSLLDFNIMAERMGWLPSAPQLDINPLTIMNDAKKHNDDPIKYLLSSLSSEKIKFAAEDPDNYNNFPRNMFVWRSNLLGASGKGHEYFLKYLLGIESGLIETDEIETNTIKPINAIWRDATNDGKLDLLINIDFRISTTGLYADIVLPTASWYEKDDLNTSDMHPFIHPLSAAIDPVWETRSDWEIYKGLAKSFSDIVRKYKCFEHIEQDIVLTPLLHDTPLELGQALDVKEWKYNEIEMIPGKTMPNITIVERNYDCIDLQFMSLGPLLKKLGNNCKGLSWNTDLEIDFIGKINGLVKTDGISKGLPKIDTAINAAEIILLLAPETNGEVAVKAWHSLEQKTGLHHVHLATNRECDKIRFRDIIAQPRKIISSPIWSGIESEHVSYNAGYTNVTEFIPWRTLTGRQQFYQDHLWMREFGESLCVYKPPIDTKTISYLMKNSKENVIALNFITPHQKWGIHSTYSENLLMLTLNRGGPVIWISELDAKKININDNDWIEAYNINGSIVARAIVSQRIPEGMSLMYHAQEKIVNVPLSEITGLRGGIHNSVTRVSLKPTHMIGGYAQQAWGFNYYGTVGANRDEFIIVKKMAKINWGYDESLNMENLK
ncbi:MAG TPA: nitrate reductase subunit alpha [Candidatus Azoamicus sp. OHIO2]